MQFQQENNLEIDGKVGPQTWHALCESLPTISFPTNPIPPIEEICGDGFDNNFDGTIDENCEGQGPTPANETAPPIIPIEEICGDGFDNNFDGTIDENCEGQGPTPANETAPPIIPIEEICGDGFDNNFDGTIDENCATPETTPVEECSTTDGSVDNTLSVTESLGPCATPIDPPCDASNTPEQFENYNKGGVWNFEFGVVNEEGLVLRNIFAKNNHVLDRISVTHFKVNLPISGSAPFIVRYCEAYRYT